MNVRDKGMALGICHGSNSSERRRLNVIAFIWSPDSATMRAWQPRVAHRWIGVGSVSMVIMTNHGSEQRWPEHLGIVDTESGSRIATACLQRILEPGRRVLATEPEATTSLLLFSGFLARAHVLHTSGQAATDADNPVVSFTLLRAQAENAAGILYAKDHPKRRGGFLGSQPYVRIGSITNYAEESTRFGGFKGIYRQLSEFAHPGPKGMLVSSRIAEDNAIAWNSIAPFRTERDRMCAYAWIVELAEASRHLLFELAVEIDLLAAPSE